MSKLENYLSSIHQEILAAGRDPETTHLSFCALPARRTGARPRMETSVGGKLTLMARVLPTGRVTLLLLARQENLEVVCCCPTEWRVSVLTTSPSPLSWHIEPR